MSAMDDLELLSRVKKELLHTVYANETSARTHVRVHCPCCGDSKKTPNGTHCYVNVEGGKPISYFCHLCNEGGWVQSWFLRALNIFDLEISTGVRKYNARFYGKDGTKRRGGSKGDSIIGVAAQTVVPLTASKLAHIDKLKYISDRLGVDLTVEDIPRFRIVVSLADFLRVNAIPLNERMRRMARLLENQYVGFLSTDGSYIIFRNTKKDDHDRYVNYPVYVNKPNASKSYIIPSHGTVDIMSDDVTLNVTEGIMDVLGCYFHIAHRASDNVLYGAVNGSGFPRFIREILRVGFIDNLNVNLYSDTDKSKSFHRKLKEIQGLKSVNIWYNRMPGEKDIGVPAERIDVRRIKMRF